MHGPPDVHFLEGTRMGPQGFGPPKVVASCAKRHLAGSSDYDLHLKTLDSNEEPHF